MCIRDRIKTMRILPFLAFAAMSACGGVSGGYGTDAFQEVPVADASLSYD